MVDLIQNFSNVIEGLFVGSEVVLIRNFTRTGMAEDFADFFPTDSCLNPSGPGGTTKTAEAQSVWFSVFNSGPFASGFESSFNGCDAKDKIRIILQRLFPKCFQFLFQSRTDWDSARLKGFRRQRGELDKAFVDVLPAETKDFSRTHTGIDSADQDRFEMRDPSGTYGEQPILFVKGHNAIAFTFVGDGDQSLTTAKRTLNDPAFPFCDVEKSPSQSQFTVNAGKTSGLMSQGLTFETVGFEGLQIGVGNRSERTFTKESIQGAGETANGVRGAESGNFPIINVHRGNGVAVEIPLHSDRELNLRPVPSRGGKTFSFSQGLSKTVASFGFGGTRTPQSAAFPILHPGYAGVDSSVLDDDLELMFPHLYGSLYFGGSFWVGEGCFKAQSDSGKGKIQGVLHGKGVLSCFEGDSKGYICLTSNQKVAGSSPAGCIKSSKKSPQTLKVKLPGNWGSTQSPIRCFSAQNRHRNDFQALGYIRA